MDSKITKFFCLQTVENRKVYSYGWAMQDEREQQWKKKKTNRERERERSKTKTRLPQSKWTNKSELRTSLSIKESDLGTEEEEDKKINKLKTEGEDIHENALGHNERHRDSTQQWKRCFFSCCMNSPLFFYSFKKWNEKATKNVLLLPPPRGILESLQR